VRCSSVVPGLWFILVKCSIILDRPSQKQAEKTKRANRVGSCLVLGTKIKKAYRIFAVTTGPIAQLVRVADS
jgi:hypothetical protein